MLSKLPNIINCRILSLMTYMGCCVAVWIRGVYNVKYEKVIVSELHKWLLTPLING